MVHANGRPTPEFRFFQCVQLLEEKRETSASVSVGDLNGDGLLDIVLAKGRHWPLHSRVLLNDDRKGHFPACQPLPTESATSIVAADFDGDGTIDLFVPHRDGGRSIILWNDGKGVVYGMAFADFNGDGWPDIVAARSHTPQRHLVQHTSGRGSLVATVRFQLEKGK